jgi:hypothetical protein
MVGNPRSDLQLLFSVTSFGLLQVCVYLILVTLSSNDFNKLDIDSLSVYVYIDTWLKCAFIFIGAFAAMAILGKLDQILAPRGISMTIAPLGAVTAVLFATPSSPAARVLSLYLSLGPVLKESKLSLMS